MKCVDMQLVFEMVRRVDGKSDQIPLDSPARNVFTDLKSVFESADVTLPQNDISRKVTMKALLDGKSKGAAAPFSFSFSSMVPPPAPSSPSASTTSGPALSPTSRFTFESTSSSIASPFSFTVSSSTPASAQNSASVPIPNSAPAPVPVATPAPFLFSISSSPTAPTTSGSTSAQTSAPAPFVFSASSSGAVPVPAPAPFSFGSVASTPISPFPPFALECGPPSSLPGVTPFAVPVFVTPVSAPASSPTQQTAPAQLSEVKTAVAMNEPSSYSLQDAAEVENMVTVARLLPMLSFEEVRYYSRTQGVGANTAGNHLSTDALVSLSHVFTEWCGPTYQKHSVRGQVTRDSTFVSSTARSEASAASPPPSSIDFPEFSIGTTSPRHLQEHDAGIIAGKTVKHKQNPGGSGFAVPTVVGGVNLSSAPTAYLLNEKKRLHPERFHRTAAQTSFHLAP